jgi:hypothetical protein
MAADRRSEMTRRFAWGSGLILMAMTGALGAQAPGTATGKGTIDNRGTAVPFVPHIASAYVQNFQALRFTWIILTEKAVPAGMLNGTADHTEALRQWCEKEKTPFAALQLDAKSGVNQYVTCPANGGTNTEMVNSVNGLDSIAVKVEARDTTRIKGSIKTGTGACPGPGDTLVYCTATGNYTFDAAFVK